MICVNVMLFHLPFIAAQVIFRQFLRILASSEVGVFCKHMFLSIQIYYAEPR